MNGEPDEDGQAIRSPASQVRSGTLVLTNLTKVVGLAIGVKAGLLDSQHDTATMAFAAFLCTGAQVSERVLLALVDRFFGRGP